MNRYEAAGIVRLHIGRLQLTPGQAAVRMHVLEAVDEESGVYEMTGPVEFKIGEQFGYDGDVPKSMAASLQAQSGTESRPKRGRPKNSDENNPDSDTE